MEGFPLNEFNNNLTSYQGLDATCSTESIMNSMSGTIQNITWLPIITMKEELINHMKADFTSAIQLDEEVEKYLDGTSNLIIKFMERFKAQHHEMLEKERRMKQVIEENNKDIKVITTFIEFLIKIEKEYNKDTGDLEKDIQLICDDIKTNSRMKEVKEEYLIEQHKFYKYLNIIKLLNQMNVGSTCSICLQDNVDSYFNPCGHTACHKCCDKNTLFNNNCPLCRKDIISINKLYFT